MRTVMSVTAFMLAGAASAASNGPVAMYRAVYSNEGSVPDAVRTECDFASRLDESLRVQAPRRGANIEFVQNEADFANASRQLFVTISDVNANEWYGVNYRPSSIVTFFVKLVVDGRTIKESKKRIRSSPSFTACKRLERIANTSGAFVSEWLTRIKY